MRLSFLVLCFALCCAQTAVAESVRIFGRSFDKSVFVYGTFIAPPGVTERADENAKFEVFLKPTLTFKQYSDKTSLVGYSILGLIKDSQGFTFDNKITFSVGVELQHKISPAVRLSFGARWKTEREFSTGIVRSRLILTADANLYKTWRPEWLSKNVRSGSEFILSGWANYRFPGSLHRSEKNNGILQGSIKFALSMPIGKKRVSIAPFTSLKAKADHVGRSFNNTIEPAIGVDLKVPLPGSGSIAFGLKTAHQLRHATGTTRTGNSAYVTWFKKF